MKKNCLLLVLLSFSITSLFSQWTFKKGETDFDGSYKTSSVFGYGGSFPYQKPLFVINKFDDGTPNIYITGAGYSGCDGKQILFKFKGDDRIYRTSYVTEGRESESWFIESFENLGLHDFFILLKKNSLMSVRMLSDCSKKDYKFSLNGSAKAIDFVVGRNWIKEQLEMEKLLIKIKAERDSLKKKKEAERDSLKKIELKRKKIEDSLLVIRIKEKRLRLKRRKDSIKKREIELEKQKKQELLDKCLLYKRKYNGNYDCYRVTENTSLRRRMQDFDNTIPINKDILILIDKTFKNKAFFKVKHFDDFGLVDYYIFKSEVKFLE